MAKILIVDDHSIVRMGVRLMLERAGFSVVGEASTGVDAVRMATQLCPDLIILDINLPNMDGFGVLHRLLQEGGGHRVLIYTGMDAAGYSVRCSRAGAIGFVSKAGGIDELLTSVQIALAGYTLFPTDQHSSVDISLRFLPESDVLEALSGRELEVLRYLAKGCRVRDIAREMLLSEKTISTYKSRLIDKLQLSNFVELIDFAKRNGLV